MRWSGHALAQIEAIGHTEKEHCGGSFDLGQDDHLVRVSQRRSQTLAQLSSDVDNNTLSQKERRRIAFLAIFVLHDMSDAGDRSLSVSTHAANHHEVRLVQLCFDFLHDRG